MFRYTVNGEVVAGFYAGKSRENARGMFFYVHHLIEYHVRNVLFSKILGHALNPSH